MKLTTPFLNFSINPKKIYSRLLLSLQITGLSFLQNQVLKINENNRRWPSLYDKNVFGFKGNKNDFVNKIEQNKTSIDFSGFEPTLNLIDLILRT